MTKQNRPTGQGKQQWSGMLWMSLFLLCTVLFSACSLNVGGDSGSGSPPASTPGAHAQQTPEPTGGASGAEPCPDALKDPLHWNTLVGLGTDQVIEQVLCGQLMGTAIPQAIVTVRHAGESHILDVHVYTNISAAHPVPIFTRGGLWHGDAKISGYSTILTAEAERQSPVNAHKSDANLTVDLFREFKWTTGQGRFIQVAFPGIYPDLTRYQAEADQARVTQGQDQWKSYAIAVARACVITYLKWGPTTAATPLIGGNEADLGALVQVSSQDAGTRPVKVSLRRLEGNVKNGIWIVQDLEADGMSITTPVPLAQFTSPVTISGMGQAALGRIGRVAVLDHLDTAVGEAAVIAGTGSGPATFSVAATYAASGREGAEEGIIVFYAVNEHGSLPAAAVTVKVLLSA